MADARAVCHELGIQLQVVNLESEFRSAVIDYFCDSYARGRTPNPCLACNRHLKFGVMLHLAQTLGFELLATGHYARIGRRGDRYQLLRGIDRLKDQSYALFMLGQEQLRRTLFPLGCLTKAQVRDTAESIGLPTASRKESQDACFISERDYHALLARERPNVVRPGPIVDRSGSVLGQHRGIAFYTIGQRRGLGLTSAYPMYVLSIDPAHNAIVVGPREATFAPALIAESVSYVAGQPPRRSLAITAKIRYSAPEAVATLTPLYGERAKVSFATPQPSITPGQAVVFYDDDVVLGGGVITESCSEVEANA